MAANETLLAFIRARLADEGARQAGPASAGIMALVEAFEAIAPQARKLSPGFDTGIADGLGQALRIITMQWAQHLDYLPEFCVGDSARPEAWTALGVQDTAVSAEGQLLAVPGSWRVPGMPTARHYDPGREVEVPGSEVQFPPLQNGLDYLLSVTEHLTAGAERVSARDLKYAVLHLAAAAEVLLKHRLRLEHWSLVFTDPAKARRSELEAGTLSSCTPKEAVERLQNIVGVSISAEQARLLTKLAGERNALQHFGLVATARAIESRAGEVLDFLVAFLDQELVPALDADEFNRIEIDMERIRGGLGQIQGYTTKRMQRLDAELRDKGHSVLRCPDCRNWALHVPTPGVVVCHFCHRVHNPIHGAEAYAMEILGRTWEACGNPFAPEGFVDEGSPATWSRLAGVDPCPSCTAPSVVRGALFRTEPAAPVDFCFMCTARTPTPSTQSAADGGDG
ncbi:hypothetical protein ACIPWI_29825 [Streptomyces sp. NPDC090046]|uniref:hypothetical protein n=1 Tax=Streptomyces sp. NPDC090046 TaxID=3365928 RepID=UPI0037F33267